jgi:hypothetical protein
MQTDDQKVSHMDSWTYGWVGGGHMDGEVVSSGEKLMVEPRTTLASSSPSAAHSPRIILRYTN